MATSWKQIKRTLVSQLVPMRAAGPVLELEDSDPRIAPVLRRQYIV